MPTIPTGGQTTIWWSDPLFIPFASGWGLAVGGWAEEAKGRADRPGRPVPDLIGWELLPFAVIFAHPVSIRKHHHRLH